MGWSLLRHLLYTDKSVKATNLNVFFGPETSVKFGYWQMWFWKKNTLHVMSCELGSWPLFCILSVCSIFIYSKAHWLYVRRQAIWETSVPSVCSLMQESLEMSPHPGWFSAELWNSQIFVLGTGLTHCNAGDCFGFIAHSTNGRWTCQ